MILSIDMYMMSTDVFYNYFHFSIYLESLIKGKVIMFLKKILFWGSGVGSSVIPGANLVWL